MRKLKYLFFLLLVPILFSPLSSHAQEENIPRIDTPYAWSTIEEGKFPNESLTEKFYVDGDCDGWKFYYKVTNQMADEKVRAGGLDLQNYGNYLEVTNLKYGDRVEVWGEKGNKTTRKEVIRELPYEKILNGSFETGISTPWKTTALNRKVQISSSPKDFNMTSAKDGKKFAYVDNNNSRSLYQEFRISAGKKYKWTASFAGSSDNEIMAIIMGPAQNDSSDYYRADNSDKDEFQKVLEYLESEYETLELYKDYDILYGKYSSIPYRIRLVKGDGRKWKEYSGNYALDKDINYMFIAFASLNSTSKNANLIDNVKIEPVDESQKKEPTYEMLHYRQVAVSELGKKGVSYELPDLPKGAHYGTPVIDYDVEWFMPRMRNYKIEKNILTFDVDKSRQLWTSMFYIPVLDSDEYLDYWLTVGVMSEGRTVVSIGLDLDHAGKKNDKNEYTKSYDGQAVTLSDVSPVITNTKDGSEVTDKLDLEYKWYQVGENEELTELQEGPRDVGNYKLVVSVKEDNEFYKGSTEYPITITKKLVDIPFFEDVVYTGKLQKANITNTDDYTVEENKGGIKVGSYSVTLKLVDDKNCKWNTDETVEDGKLTVNFAIKKSVAAVTVAPKAKKLVYTASAQELVTAGKVVNGTLKYSLDGKKWTTKIPIGTKVGTYKVYYKVVGDENNTDSSVKSVTTKIEKKEDKNALNKGLKVVHAGSKITVSWNQVKEATGYDVYLASCKKNFSSKPINTKKTTKLTVKKVDGKKIDKKTVYKVYVVAYKQSGKKKVQLGKSIVAHVVSSENAKFTNAKSIKLSKEAYTLKVGKKVTIKAKTTLVNSKKKQLSNDHAKEFRYVTSDKKVATVSKNGQLQAVNKGVCTIYVYARNGYTKQIQITVK